MKLTKLNKKVYATVGFALLATLIVVGMNQLTFAGTETDPTLDVQYGTGIFISNLDAETQGRIEGSVTQAGREGYIEIYGFSHTIASPRDAATGLPTGKRQHSPVVVTKPIDKATPLLLNVLAFNENINSMTFQFWRPTATGAEEVYYTVELVNAQISSIRTVVFEDPDTGADNIHQEVSFVYQKIIWTWQDGGITAEDDWETPVA